MVLVPVKISETVKITDIVLLPIYHPGPVETL